MKYKELKPGDCFTYDTTPSHIKIICIRDTSDTGAYIIGVGSPEQSCLIGTELKPLPPNTSIKFITELSLQRNLYDLFDINWGHQFTPLTEPFIKGDQFFFRVSGAPASEPRFITMLNDKLAIICNGSNAGEKIFINYNDLTQSSPLLNTEKILKLYND